MNIKKKDNVVDFLSPVVLANFRKNQEMSVDDNVMSCIKDRYLRSRETTVFISPADCWLGATKVYTIKATTSFKSVRAALFLELAYKLQTALSCVIDCSEVFDKDLPSSDSDRLRLYAAVYALTKVEEGEKSRSLYRTDHYYTLGQHALNFLLDLYPDVVIFHAAIRDKKMLKLSRLGMITNPNNKKKEINI